VSAVGGTLRRLRLESGISLRDLARRLGVSSAYLSRVEHGLDPTPTRERLVAFAAELDLPPGMLLEVAHRMSPLVERYVEQEPQAGALFTAIAGRALQAHELVEIQRFIERRFPRAGAATSPNVELAPLLNVDRVILGVQCDDLADACEIGATRLAGLEHMPDVSTLTSTLVARAAEVEPGLGGGVAAVAASFPGAQSAAVVVVLARPIAVKGGDGIPISVLVLLISASRGRDALLRIAHVARLGARGLVTVLSSVRHPEQALQQLASLELVE